MVILVILYLELAQPTDGTEIGRLNLTDFTKVNAEWSDYKRWCS